MSDRHAAQRRHYLLNETEQRVSFTQSYRSNTYRDRVRKAMRLAWEDGGWRILEESVIRQLPW